MRFELDHDWQGNLSTPQARVGERAKTHLLILLCAVWLLMGLIGHHPWKPFESHTMSIVKTILDTSNFLAPTAASSQIANPPLYYLSAALTSKIFGGILPMHDAARIVTGLWMLITLLMIGMTGRELWGKGFGRQTTFVFIGSLGLVISAHTLTPAISALAGLAAGFYALSLSKRRPYRAGVLLGTGAGVSFLSTGLLPLSIIVLPCIVLPILFKHWRSKSFVTTVTISLLVSSPFLVIWPLLLFLSQADVLIHWWEQSLNQFKNTHYTYFLTTLLWYTWPALPLAIWGLWRYRSQLFNNPKFQLCITFFLLAFTLIGLGGERKEIFALPLLIPLTALAGGSIETLKRGAANALNWFGLILFGLMSSLIWLGWMAMFTNSPAKIKERLTFLSGLTTINFSMIATLIALLISLVWLLAIFRSRHTNRSSATNWAIGMTCVWTLLMTIWLPMIDSARSYGDVFKSLNEQLPSQYTCINSSNLGNAQQDLLHYYTGVQTRPLRPNQQIGCDLYLIEDTRNKNKIEPGQGWQKIWHGKRISDRKESFRLFQYKVQ
jgi:4-amino-4-deoxy-L-arabinose transferase-like glycosyltransferase